MKLTENYLKRQNYSYTKEGDNLTVGGYLDLRGTNITALPDNLTVGGYLDLEGTNITSLPDNLTVGGYLDLRGTNITALPDNLTVGGYLDLRGTNITALPDNLTVGGSLYLRGTNITALPDNLTVGGSLDLEGTNIKKPKKLKRPDSDFKIKYRAYVESKLTWHNGKYRVIDGIFCEVLKTCLNIIKAKIENNKIIYIFTKDGISAHGKTIKQAYRDWLFKQSDRDCSQYENLAPDTIKDLAYWVVCYRNITGACSLGTENFIENNEEFFKKDRSLKEIIQITKGQYGHNTFKEFFKED